jgi:hypothetical protein
MVLLFLAAARAVLAAFLALPESMPVYQSLGCVSKLLV